MDPKDVKLIDDARARFDAVSDKARTAIYRKVLEHYQRHPGSPWSGAPLRDLEMMIRQFYADLGLQYDKVFRDTLQPIMQQYYDRAVEELKTAGLRNAVLGKPDTARVKYFMDSAFEQVAMKTQNMSFQHIRALRNITADVTRQMSITGATRQQVSKELLSRAMEIPGFQFIDKSGAKWPLKSYFNMLARTELMNAARSSYDDKCSEEAADIMLLTVSGHCCEHCAKYEGKLFSLSGRVQGMPSKQDLIDDGVFHPNCTHSYSLVPEYIAMKNYGIKKDDIDKAHSLKLQELHEKQKTESTKKLGQNFRSRLRSFNPEPEDQIKRFDGNFSSEQARDFDQKLRESKLSNSQIDEFNANMKLTEHLLKKTPEFDFITKKTDIAYTDIHTSKMFIRKGSGTWDGCRNTISHEWGEMLFNSVMSKTEEVKFHDAIKKDIQLVRENHFLKKASWETQDALTSELSRSIFGKDYSELSTNEQTRIFGFFDVAGSMTGGQIGFGHDNYLDEVDAGRFGNDVFAGVFVAVTHGYEEFKNSYPNTWKYMENLLKK